LALHDALPISNRKGVLKEGHDISIDGFTGEVFLGKIKTIPSEVVQVLVAKTLAPRDAPIYQRYARFMEWVDGARRLGGRANVEQTEQGADRVPFGTGGGWSYVQCLRR